MASRLHFATKYQVEYSDDTFFGRGLIDFYYLLKSLGIDMSGTSVYDTEFDIPKEDWKLALEELKSEKESKEINEALNDLGYSRSVMLGIFEKILNESDPKYDYVHISWY